MIWLSSKAIKKLPDCWISKHKPFPFVRPKPNRMKMAQLEVQPKKYKAWFYWLVGIITAGLVLFYFLSDKIIY